MAFFSPPARNQSIPIHSVLEAHRITALVVLQVPSLITISVMAYTELKVTLLWCLNSHSYRHALPMEMLPWPRITAQSSPRSLPCSHLLFPKEEPFHTFTPAFSHNTAAPLHFIALFFSFTPWRHIEMSFGKKWWHLCMFPSGVGGEHCVLCQESYGIETPDQVMKLFLKAERKKINHQSKAVRDSHFCIHRFRKHIKNLF